MKKYKTRTGEDAEGFKDFSKSFDTNEQTKTNSKFMKQKNDYRYQNFSEAINVVKLFDSKLKNLTLQRKEENNFIKKLQFENNKLNPIKVVSNKKTEIFLKSPNQEEVISEHHKHSQTDSKKRMKSNFRDFDIKENLLSKLESYEISEYSKTNAHFSREDEQKYYMKFQKNIEIRNNNVLTKSHGNKHISYANGPYRMDIKPMLGKIKEIGEFNFENQFNVKLNLNEKRKNFESVNFESLKNLNLEKIEDVNRKNYRKSVNFCDNNHNNLNYFDCYHTNKILDEVKNELLISELEAKNLDLNSKKSDEIKIESRDEKNVFSNKKPGKTTIEFQSLTKNNFNQNRNSLINLKNGAGSTACKSSKTRSDKNFKNSLHKNNGFKRSIIESKNSESNISNGLTPLNLNKNLENIDPSKESSRDNIFKDKDQDIDFKILKREYNNSLVNGKGNIPPKLPPTNFEFAKIESKNISLKNNSTVSSKINQTEKSASLKSNSIVNNNILNEKTNNNINTSIFKDNLSRESSNKNPIEDLNNDIVVDTDIANERCISNGIMKSEENLNQEMNENIKELTNLIIHDKSNKFYHTIGGNSKSQVISNKKMNNDSETKIMGEDILEDLDEIKDLDVNVKLTKSHKFPRNIFHQRKKSERKITVSDIDLSSMRESYYNSKILNLNSSSSYNPNIESISRKKLFQKFKNKNLQKNILIVDPNTTNQSFEMYSHSISVISKKNISNFEHLDKVKFNRRKNSKNVKNSFLSSFHLNKDNNLSTLRIKKAFFGNLNNIDTLFYNNIEMNSFLTIQNKSNFNQTNLHIRNYNINFDKNNSFYDNINQSLSKINLKNTKIGNIKNINEIVMFLPNNSMNNINKNNLYDFDNEMNQKNVEANIKNEDNHMLIQDGSNHSIYNNDNYKNIDKNMNILIYENYDKTVQINDSLDDRKLQNFNNNLNIKNNLNTKTNEILEISNFLNLDNNLPKHELNKNQLSDQMNENEVKIERLHTVNHPNLNNFNVFNDNINSTYTNNFNADKGRKNLKNHKENKKKVYLHTDTDIHYNNYNNENSKNSIRYETFDRYSEKCLDNFDYNNLPLNNHHTIKSKNNKSLKIKNDKFYDYKNNLKQNENLTHNKRSRPDCPSPYDSSNVVISLNNSNNFNEDKSNDYDISTKRKGKKILNFVENLIDDENDLENINKIKNDSNEIIDLNSLASSQEIHNIKTQEIKLQDNFDFIDEKDYNQNGYGFRTPDRDKTSKDKDKNKIVKIRDHNKINTDSLLKNSKFAAFYCRTKNYKENMEEQEEQIRFFIENNQGTMHNIYDLDFINNLLEKENKYRPDKNYLINHPNLNSEHRAILVDWMMEICEDLAFKRDTLHFAVNYLDRFLSKTENIEKNILQLIGVACLSISGKFEEIYIPKSEEYINITENRFTKNQLIGLEKYIISSLDWELNPTTLIMWLNWYLCQWDLFVESIPEIKEKLILFRNMNKNLKSSYCSENNNYKIIFFKKADEKSYIYYRQATQLIDAFLTDYNHLRFQTRHLIASVIFIIICMFYEIPYFQIGAQNNFIFDEDFFMELFHNNSDYELIINNVFGEFLNQSFNITFEEIIQACIYCSNFVFFEFTYDLPLIIQLKNDQFENGNYEEFLSFQTHNKKNFDFVMASTNMILSSK